MSACWLGSRKSVVFTLAVLFAATLSLRLPNADAADKVARVGFVLTSSPSTAVPSVRAFWERLGELGWVEGRNLVIEQRWAEGRIDRLPGLMAEVLGRKIDVLVTVGTPAALVAKDATNTVPIVVAMMGDPIGTGLAGSLARPGGNLTGLSLQVTEGLSGKWLELLREAVPRLSTVAVISHPDNPLNQVLVKELKNLAPKQGVTLQFIDVGDSEALDRAFKQARRGAQAVLVLVDPFTVQHHQQITALAVKHRLPLMSALRDFVDAGALMAYGVNSAVLYRRAAEYVDKILRGAKPADLPIEQPTRFELVVNLKTAKALGITIPQSILLRADEVIR